MEYASFSDKDKIKPFPLAARTWIFTSLVFGLGCGCYSLIAEPLYGIWVCLPVIICAALGSLPVLLVLAISFRYINNMPVESIVKIRRLALTCFVSTLPYALLGSKMFTDDFAYNRSHYWIDYSEHALVIAGILFGCSGAAIALSWKTLNSFFSSDQITLDAEALQEINNEDILSQ